MNKKRKSLSTVSAPPETNEATMDAILKEVGAGEGAKEKTAQVAPTSKEEMAVPSPSASKKKAYVPLSPIGQKVNANLYNEMRVYVAKRKNGERGYSIKTFLEEAIKDKLVKEALKRM